MLLSILGMIMAKVCIVQRNLKRLAMNNSQQGKRDKLKALIKDPKCSFVDKIKAQRTLTEMPRNGSKVRYRNRCPLTGRGRGYYGKFGVSRLMLRSLASDGYLPGVVKSSW